MMRIIFAALGVLLWAACAYPQQDSADPACVNECSVFTPDCTTYIECKIAKSECLTNCMQRKVWEKVSLSLDKLTAVLEQEIEEKKKKAESEEKKPEEKQATTQKQDTMGSGY
jgi:hypothetical protein